MSSHEMYEIGACCLENLIDGNYSYFHDEENLDLTLNQTPYRQINKRKPRNGRYEWEYDDAA